MKRSIVTDAIIDTGYEKGLLLSKELSDLLFLIGDPEREDSLGSGYIEIPGNVFFLRIKVFNRWLLTEFDDEYLEYMKITERFFPPFG